MARDSVNTKVNSKLSNEEAQVLDLGAEIDKLEKKKAVLTREISEKSDELNKLNAEIVGVEEKAKNIIADAEAEAVKIKSDASALYAKVKEDEKSANDKMGEAIAKIEEAKKVKKEADEALNKSNNAQANNDAVAKGNEALRIKLINISSKIKEMLGE